MKTIFPRSLLLLGMTALVLTACGQSEPKASAAAESPAAPAPAAPAAPTTAEVVAQLKGYTYEQRAGFSLLVQDLGRQADAVLVGLSAGYIEVKSSPALRKAMAALRAASADFKDKTATVDNAKEENWESIRTNLTTSWENLQGAQAGVRAKNT